MIVVLAEKPSVARDLAVVLGARTRREGFFEGAGYRVTWAIGHLVGLAQPHEVNPAWRTWLPSTLPMLPREYPLVVLQEGRAQYRVVERLLRDKATTSVVAATDAGREGELIFRYIYEHARCDKPWKRLWVSSLTHSAIRAAFDRLEPGARYDGLAAAAKARSRADWLVGMNLSRAYTLSNGTLFSVGRVQTPTLAMVVARDREIRDFVPEKYLEVEATFDSAQGPYRGTYHARMEGPLRDARGRLQVPKAERARLPEDGVLAEQIAQRAREGQPRVVAVERRQQKTPPPLLYDLTELQRHANRLYGFTAKRTLDLAQVLYERYKVLSYPRTDSRHLSNDVAQTLPDVIAAIAPRYEGLCAPGTGERSLSRRFVDDSKVGDHHALIPTAEVARLPEGSPEAKLYDLVCRRLLMAWHAEKIEAVTTVLTEIVPRATGESVETDLYVTRGISLESPGWSVLERTSSRAVASTEPIVAAGLSEGDTPGVTEVVIHRKQTQPPKPYTEATLLTAMETAGRTLDDKALFEAMRDAGLGTPATRAAILETLLARGYLVRDGKSLVSTPAGETLVDAVHPQVKSAAMTGSWELRLKRMERGEEPFDAFMNGIEQYVTEVVGEVVAPDAPRPGSRVLAPARSQARAPSRAPVARENARSSDPRRPSLPPRAPLPTPSNPRDSRTSTARPPAGRQLESTNPPDPTPASATPSDPKRPTSSKPARANSLTSTNSATPTNAATPARAAAEPTRAAAEPTRANANEPARTAAKPARAKSSTRTNANEPARAAAEPTRANANEPARAAAEPARMNSAARAAATDTASAVTESSRATEPVGTRDLTRAIEPVRSVNPARGGSNRDAHATDGTRVSEGAGGAMGARAVDAGARGRGHGGDRAEVLEGLLHSRFRFASFRSHQREICEAVARGEDALVVMPTGAGKSLCYQLPGIARGGTTLVISPLIALIEDQCAKLQHGGLRAERIHSGRDRADARDACRRYLSGELDFLFIAPERLRVAGFPEMLAKRPPVLIAIDEAHCISQWGHDFRPDYRMLRERLAILRPTPIVALTATATPDVQRDIVEQLAVPEAQSFILGFRRHNLAIEVLPCAKTHRAQTTRELLAKPGALPAIVYTPTRKATAEVTSALRGVMRVGAYHAGLASETRERVQSRFLAGKLDCIVATIAFGMGIDKADVRTVVHTGLPSSLEGYYQEIGRAGRDGRPSRAVLLHGPTDRKMHNFFLERDYPPERELAALHAKLSSTPIDRASLATRARKNALRVDSMLEKLWVHGGAVIDAENRVTRGAKDWRPGYAQQRNHRADQLERVADFVANAQRCRMAALVEHFGERSDTSEACGHCDVCAPGETVAVVTKSPATTRPWRGARKKRKRRSTRSSTWPRRRAR